MRRVRLSLVAPFETSFGVQAERDILLLKAITSDGEGWGECVAGEEPTYSSEYVEGCQHVLIHHLLPRLLARSGLQAEDVGVSVGIHKTIPELLETVGDYLEQGYRRIKLKIKPGWDLEPVRAVRERFGKVPLQVDANTAYSLSDAAQLALLDEFDLLLIEQPLPEDQVLAHAQLAKSVRTPICLDESITSARAAADAIALGACRIINVKPGRVGGYLEARRIHDLCASHGVPVWMGGMLETGIGRAGNVAMAAMPNFTLPGDTSASDRYYHRDITEPFVLHDGRLDVPKGPGLGVEVDAEFLESITHWKQTVGA